VTRLATWTVGNDRDRATLAFLLDALGIAGRPVADPADAGDGPLLAHGPLEPGPGRVVIPYRADDARSLAPDLVRRLEVDAGAHAVLPFDVVSVIGALLRDEPAGAIGADGRDEHGRVRFDASTAARTDVDGPLVDRLAERTGWWLQRRLGITGADRWPDGALFAVGLSHDVDHPDRYPTLRAIAGGPGRLARAPRTLALRALDDLGSLVRQRQPGEFWVFDRLVESEASRGFAATWFFATTPFHARWGVTYDVAYDVADARFRRVFDQLAEAGHEVGLHTGYDAFAAPGRIADERARLVRASGAPVDGNRHHYWHLGPDPAATLRVHEAAGFRYDSSIAFNDHVGFRRSTSLPFHPFDAPSSGPLRLRELPVFAMDGNLFYHSNDVEAAVATIAAGFDDLAEVRGMAVFDWHLQACVPTRSAYAPWAEAYQAVLDLLAARPDVWVTDLGSIDRWWSERRERIEAAADAPPRVS
jgi:hypothetical protein